jgi:hypothetical protein
LSVCPSIDLRIVTFLHSNSFLQTGNQLLASRPPLVYKIDTEAIQHGKKKSFMDPETNRISLDEIRLLFVIRRQLIEGTQTPSGSRSTHGRLGNIRRG